MSCNDCANPLSTKSKNHRKQESGKTTRRSDEKKRNRLHVHAAHHRSVFSTGRSSSFSTRTARDSREIREKTRTRRTQSACLIPGSWKQRRREDRRKVKILRFRRNKKREQPEYIQRIFLLRWRQMNIFPRSVQSCTGGSICA